MTTNTFLNVCPHCGFESEDDEICRACGHVFYPIKPKTGYSLSQGMINGFSKIIWNDCSCLTKISKIDIGEEATIKPLLGSTWFIHFHDFEND